MIETIKNTAFSLCLSAIFGSVLFYLLPKSSFQKLFCLIFCLFFLCSLTAPLMKGSLENWFRIPRNEEEGKNIDLITEDIFETGEEFVEKETEQKTRTFLGEHAIVPQEVIVDVHISEDGGITLNRFSIVLKESDVFPELCEEITKEIGLEPDIQIGEDEKNEID